MPILITLITVAAVVAICAAAWWIDAREARQPADDRDYWGEG